MCNRSKYKIVTKFDEINGAWVVFIDNKRYPRDKQKAYLGTKKDKRQVIMKALEDRIISLKYKVTGYRNYY
jgi:hypothetical protein